MAPAVAGRECIGAIRRRARAELYRSIGTADSPTSWGLRMFIGETYSQHAFSVSRVNALVRLLPCSRGFGQQLHEFRVRIVPPHRHPVRPPWIVNEHPRACVPIQWHPCGDAYCH
ncbi:DUF7676 family protein [Streptosporangium subroseum]|uniref:DUF7676 family protein n=1 Tax=Streptosporangium subroseum TaxID=106412 RepID=UPI003F4E077E